MGVGDVRYLSVEAIAKRLNVHPETVRVWIRNGRLQAIQDNLHQGGPYLVEEQDLNRFIAENRRVVS
jgi:excisionase family DNA binding protein